MEGGIPWYTLLLDKTIYTRSQPLFWCCFNFDWSAKINKKYRIHHIVSCFKGISIASKLMLVMTS